ncbi:hypothetical protein [Streptomyces sp. M54]|uniref:hypothetical protein n=1 Tax=Streptomyces sp. M54 TaxID=2759525 RepID=UPI001FB082FD|nr:hypothetical protein [Streptomyces sp. M54]
MHERSDDGERVAVGAARTSVDYLAVTRQLEEVVTSGANSFPEVAWPANCRPQNETTALCTTPELPGDANAPAARIILTAMPGATDGNVRYTAQASGMNVYPGETYVALNDGPALGLPHAEHRTGIAPDQPDSSVVLRNQGNRTADRTLLTIYGAPWLPVRCPGDCMCSDCSGAVGMWADARHAAREELGEELGEDSWFA